MRGFQFIIILFFRGQLLLAQDDGYKHIYHISSYDFDTTAISVDTLVEQTNRLQIRVTSIDGPLDSAKIIVRGSGTLYTFFSNRKGEAESNPIPQGRYKISISKFSYELLEYDLVFTKNIKLNITLGNSSPAFYEVHSKKSLTDTELKEILHCLYINIYDESKCGKTGVYYVARQI